MSIFACAITAHAANNLPEPSQLPRTEPQPKFPDISSPNIEKTTPSSDNVLNSNDDTIKVTVATFNFSGNQFVSDEQLAMLLKSFTNREVGIKELSEATKTITQYYRQNGFLLTQAYFPEQDIGGRVININIIEGNLNKLSVKTAPTLDADFLSNMAKKNFDTGAPIKEQNLLRNVTILNSLPAVKAVAQISPGERIGTSDVEIELTSPARLSGSLAANNFGNRFSGRQVLEGNILINNLAGRGDQLSLDLRRSTGAKQRVVQLGYIVPIHDSGSLLSFNYGFVDYRLGGQFSALNALGDSQTFAAYLDQPLYRTRQLSLTGRFGGSYKKVSDEVQSIGFDNNRNISALDFGLFGDWRDVSFGGYNQLGLTLKTANVNFNNDVAEFFDSTGAQTAGDFIKYNLIAARTQPINPILDLTLRAEYQGSNKNLDSAEKLNIGGINRWRNFAELPTSVDRGLQLGAELRLNLLNKKALSMPIAWLSPYVFLDAGKGDLNHSALSINNEVNAIQTGLGLDARFAKRWLFNIAASYQQRQVQGTDREDAGRVWTQLQVEF